MIIDDYNLLSELWAELCQEEAELETQIQYNLRCMKEAEAYVNTFLQSETEDFKVFSPRRAEIIYKDEIDKANRKRESYEVSNKELCQRKDIISGRIKKLESILNRQNCNLILLDIQEEDRRRIARDLHDTSLQNMTHLIHKIELSSMYIDKDPIQAKLELAVVSKCLRETIEEVRGIIFDLRPMNFDDLGVKATIEQLLATINEEGKYEIISNIEEINCENDLVLVSIYRIVQEAFCNIVKHAEADKINFCCMKTNGKCILTIEDNGKGFCEKARKNSREAKNHFGISLMKERVELLNGSIEIHSAKGKGTKILIEIPLDVMRD